MTSTPMMTREPIGDVEPHDNVVIEGITKKFGDIAALRGVSITIKKGEFVTLLGPSGCGKTTLLRIITGLEVQDEGQLFLNGQEVSDVPPHKRPVSLVFQNLALFPHMTVAQNIAFPLEMARMRRAEINKQVAEYLQLVRLEGYEDRAVTELSGGQRQRVALARSLAHKPTVLLLDEPLSALDEKLRKEMQVELKAFQEQMGTTFIYVTHDQEEALVMSDRIAVFNNGEIEQFGRPLEVYKDPATTFVADFVGETNLLPCVIRGVDASSVVDGGFFSAPCPESFSAKNDREYYVSIRPEQIWVARNKSEEANASRVELEATVEDVLFYGSDVKVRATVTSGVVLNARIAVNSFDNKLTEGETVYLSWRVEAQSIVQDRI